jgi:DNA-binding CsgD family transcriptional regulator
VWERRENSQPSPFACEIFLCCGALAGVVPSGASAEALVSPQMPFSAREAQVCLLLVEGLVLREVALRLNISIYTADHHKKSIYRKLRVHSRAELLRALYLHRDTGVIPSGADATIGASPRLE